MIVCKNCGGFVGAKNVSRTATPSKSGAKVQYIDVERFRVTHPESAKKNVAPPAGSPKWTDIVPTNKPGTKTYLQLWNEVVGECRNLPKEQTDKGFGVVWNPDFVGLWPMGPFQMLMCVSSENYFHGAPLTDFAELSSAAINPSSGLRYRVCYCSWPGFNPTNGCY